MLEQDALYLGVDRIGEPHLLNDEGYESLWSLARASAKRDGYPLTLDPKLDSMTLRACANPSGARAWRRPLVWTRSDES